MKREDFLKTLEKYKLFQFNGKGMAPLAKKNMHTIFMSKYGKRCVSPSAKYKQWAVQFRMELKHQWGMRDTITSPIIFVPNFGFDTKHKRDLSNFYQGVEDEMQAAGVIKDDSLILAHLFPSFKSLGNDCSFMIFCVKALEVFYKDYEDHHYYFSRPKNKSNAPS